MPQIPRFAVPFQWSALSTYDTNVVVYNLGKTYTALKPVPTNTLLTNTEYWEETGPRIGAIDSNSVNIAENSTNIDNMLISLYTPQSTQQSQG